MFIYPHNALSKQYTFFKLFATKATMKFHLKKINTTTLNKSESLYFSDCDNNIHVTRKEVPPTHCLAATVMETHVQFAFSSVGGHMESARRTQKASLGCHKAVYYPPYFLK